jgi:hypothetical protein
MMSDQEQPDLQNTPGTEEQTGNPDAEVGEEAVPNDLPGPGDQDQTGRTGRQPSNWK